MAKPAKWDSMTPGEQEAWRVKKREIHRKWREANREKLQKSSREYYKANREKALERAHKYRKVNHEKVRESSRKRQHKTRQQTAADQFFIMAGAAEQLTKLKPKQ